MKPIAFNVQLLTLIASKMPWLSGDQFPREMKLLDFGVNPTRKGPVRLGQNTRALFSNMQRERGFDRVALDFEHNTVPGTKAYKESSEPRPVAAYGVPELRGDGLYLTQIEPTPEGKKSGRNFIDLSPAPELDDNGEVIFLHSVALCRQGAVDDLTLDKAACYAVELPAGAGSNQNNGRPSFALGATAGDPATGSEDELMDKILAALRKGLGLAEAATDEDIAKCLSTMSAELADAKAKIVTLSASAKATADKSAEKSGDAQKENPELVTLTAEVKDLAGKVATFAAEIEKRDRSDLVALACREGKVLPLNAEQVSATPVATLRDMVKNLAVTVPVEKRTPIHVQEFSVIAEPELTEAQKQIARNCGVDPEKIKAKK